MGTEEVSLPFPQPLRSPFSSEDCFVAFQLSMLDLLAIPRLCAHRVRSKIAVRSNPNHNADTIRDSPCRCIRRIARLVVGSDKCNNLPRSRDRYNHLRSHIAAYKPRDRSSGTTRQRAQRHPCLRDLRFLFFQDKLILLPLFK
jgi:hypothetical protein